MQALGHGRFFRGVRASRRASRDVTVDTLDGKAYTIFDVAPYEERLGKGSS